MGKIERMIELARAHVEQGAANAAEVYYRMVLKETDPPKSGVERLARGEACMWRARQALHDGRQGAAVDWYMRALQADPLAVDYRVEYCVRALIPMGMFKNARIEAERATRIDPVSTEAWRTLGGVEAALGNVEASVAAYDRQLDLAPDDPNARLDRATIALDTGDYETVRDMCSPVLNTDRAPDAQHALAMATYREAHHEAAITMYDAAIAGGCYDPSLARWNKSLALHSIGRYREGWEAHEHRGRQKTDGAMALVMNRFQAPAWTTRTGPCRLHVHQEMGHGDTIAMARYLPQLLEEGHDVRLEVNDSMVGLMARSFPRVQVMAKAVDYPGALGLPPFDFHVPMLSLPDLFRTDIDTVPWPGPYLRPSDTLASFYREKLANVAHRETRKVGLCWSSGIRTEGLWIGEYGRRKSMPLEELSRVCNDDDAFVSLQSGPERAELAEPTFDHRRSCEEIVHDLLPKRPQWDDTAALIANLDLVITVDTAVAHLAGAMGVPVWIMMQRDGQSWHFMCWRPGASWNEASPWYPSARIFRQHEFNRPHIWDDVIRDVAAALAGGQHADDPHRRHEAAGAADN